MKEKRGIILGNRSIWRWREVVRLWVSKSKKLMPEYSPHLWKVLHRLPVPTMNGWLNCHLYDIQDMAA
jgi:hypothetical protein